MGKEETGIVVRVKWKDGREEEKTGFQSMVEAAEWIDGQCGKYLEAKVYPKEEREEDKQ